MPSVGKPLDSFVVQLLVDGRLAVSARGNARIVMSRQAFTKFMEWATSPHETSKEQVRRTSPEFFKVVENQLGIPVFSSNEKSVWRTRMGPAAAHLHDMSQETTYSKQVLVFMELEPAPDRELPRLRDVPNRGVEISMESTLDVSAGFDEVRLRRRSHRRFTPGTIELASFSYALTATFGVLGHADPGVGNVLPYKSYFSSGSRHELWPAVVVYDVEGLEPGLYYYHDEDNKLVRVADAPTRDEMDEVSFHQGFAMEAQFIVFFVSDLVELSWKYRSPAAYRLAWADAGAALQTFGMALTAVGLAGVPTAALREDIARSALQLSDDEIIPLAFYGGVPSGSPTVETVTGPEPS